MENLENYYPEKVKIRDNEILSLLKQSQIGTKNIKNLIDYFLLEIDYEKLLDNGSPIINTVSKFWYQLFSLILVVVISKFNLQEFEQERITLFIAAVLVLVVTGIIILAVRVVNYLIRRIYI